MSDGLENSGIDVRKGSLLEDLEIVDVTVDGKAVARYRGRVVFLDRGLPGAVVSARVTGVKKGLILAEVERESRPSAHQTEPWCPHFPDCGACLWQHMSLPAALEWKRTHVRETLARIGKIRDIPVWPVQPSLQDRNFRNKMSFAFGTGPGGDTQLGLRKLKGHELVQVRDCALAPPVTMDILEHARAATGRLGLRARQRISDSKARRGIEGYLRFLIVRTPAYVKDGKAQTLVECITGPEHRLRTRGGREKAGNAEAVRILGQELAERFSLCGFIHSERAAASDLAQGEKTVFTLGQDSFEERFGHIVLKVPHNAFLQTNTGVAEALYRCIEEEASLGGTEVVWDIYSGVGSVGLFLARHAAAVHGFELHPQAVAAARENAASLGYDHCAFHEGAVTAASAKGLPAPAVIVADPPRSGLSQEAVELLLRAPAKKLLYISCNAATQARDAALLAERWEAVKCRPFDMFPCTPHVENLMVFNHCEA